MRAQRVRNTRRKLQDVRQRALSGCPGKNGHSDVALDGDRLPLQRERLVETLAGEVGAVH